MLLDRYRGTDFYYRQTYMLFAIHNFRHPFPAGIKKVKQLSLVHDADPKAFVFANTIKEASGGIIKRRHKH